MLAIRREQLDVLSGAMFQQFEDRVDIQLRRLFPNHPSAAAPDGFRPLIRAGVTKADTYGITDEADVERFLIWIAPYGLEFECHPDLPWVSRLLSDRYLTGTQKVNELENSSVFAKKP